jgi:Predicted nucleotide-binding protein containing TIR-like domain
MEKPRLFIGSSSEAKDLAEQIQMILDDVAEVKIWDQQTFFPGEHPLESLRREVLQTDFALLLVTPDDKIRKRDKAGYSVRDNILFELGMFMGVLGPRRSFYLVVEVTTKDHKKKQLMLPSDLAGITRVQMAMEEGKDSTSSLRKACTQLKDAIRRAANNIDVTLLPSTALAIGYFNNFVCQVCHKLSSLTDFQVNGHTFNLQKDLFDFLVVLPNSASDASHEGFTKFVRKNQLVKIEVEGESKSRTFPFFVDSKLKNGRLLLFDYPTTLRAAREAIRIALPAGSATDHEIERLEEREIANFERTLRKMLQEPSAADFRDNVKILYVDELGKIY